MKTSSQLSTQFALRTVASIAWTQRGRLAHKSSYESQARSKKNLHNALKPSTKARARGSNREGLRESITVKQRGGKKTIEAFVKQKELPSYTTFAKTICHFFGSEMSKLRYMYILPLSFAAVPSETSHKLLRNYVLETGHWCVSPQKFKHGGYWF